MCGIAGAYQPNGSINRVEIDRLTDALAHRGPDGRGSWVQGEIGLGHRRLAILDLSDAGACPMHYSCPHGRQFVITFNGEVYNFIELRRELQAKGYSFRSDTDTEVVVAAYAEWGPECLKRFNGMFAIAIWDAAERTLFLARDRFGIKPLYFHIAQKLSFASEMKAFLELDSFVARLNEQAAVAALQSPGTYEGQIDETLLQDVRRLPAGCFLMMRSSCSVQVERWWETAANIPAVSGSYEQQVEQFLELFLDSIKLRMRSDVPIATCLSGGVDSSAVTSAMSWLRNNADQLERCPENSYHAFIATFPGTALDERRFAEVVVEDTGVTPHYWEFSSDKSLHHFVDSLWSMEEVYSGLAVPVWCTYREVRNAGLSVTLDGHGADELLCGYPWTLDWPMREVNENLYADFHMRILPAILRNFDRCSMAHGVEIRTPFLDYRLVTFLFGLEPDAKIGGGFTKRILRDAMDGILHKSVRTRRQKIGFNSPMIEWYNGGLAPLIENVMQHPLWLQSPFFDGPGSARSILDKTKRKAWTLDDWGLSLQVWSYMNLVLWQLLFIEQDRESVEQMMYASRQSDLRARM